MKNKKVLSLLCLLLPMLILGCQQSKTSQNQAPSSPVATQSTPSPQPTTIPGWKKFEGRGAQLQLPESYDGGDLSKDLDVIVQKLEAGGPTFKQTAQIIKQNPSLFVIWVFDTKVGKSGVTTNVNVTTEAVVSAITLDIYLDVFAKQLPKEWRIVEQKVVSLDRYQAGQTTTEFTVSGVKGKQIIYTIKEGNNIWNVTFSTSADEFAERLPTFQKSISTFLAGS